jgi:predicted acylesterase/phospholipase RssA
VRLVHRERRRRARHLPALGADPPAWGEIARRLASLPALATQATYRYVFKRRSLSSAFERLGRALPSGFFSNAMIDVQLRRQFSAPGRTNDFRQLQRKLVLVATDLDSGDPAPFGQPGLDHVPISKAVQASAALPGCFPPVEIDGRFYVDGALKKTLHASVLLEEDVDLLICLNPLVPFNSSASPQHRVLSSGEERIPRLVGWRIAGGAVADLPHDDPLAPRTRHARLRAQPSEHHDRAVRARSARSGDVSSPTPSAIRSGARFAEHRYSRRGRCCVRAAACCRRSSHRTVSSSTTAVLDDPRRTLVSRRAPRTRMAGALKRLNACSTTSSRPSRPETPEADRGIAVARRTRHAIHLPPTTASWEGRAGIDPFWPL